MQYTRFELSFDGELQDIGFLRGLESTYLPKNQTSALVASFIGLSVPSLPSTPDIQFWFTEEGMHTFASQIDDVVNAYQEDGTFDVVVKTAPALTGNIIYQDAYQVALKPSAEDALIPAQPYQPSH